jgi:hypothetical protein
MKPVAEEQLRGLSEKSIAVRWRKTGRGEPCPYEYYDLVCGSK